MVGFSTWMSIIISLACVLVTTLLWSLFKWVWLNPKKFERILRDQGFQGNPYKLYYGDTNVKTKMLMDARSKPLSNLSHDHLSHTMPSYHHHTIKNYGMKCYIWKGPTPVVNISDMKLIKEVLMKIKEFHKPLTNPLVEMVVPTLKQAQSWNNQRRIFSPAFHIEKLKLMLPAFNESTSDMIQEWEKMALNTCSCEIDVWSHLKRFSADVISRVAFGNSYEEGRKIFELVTQQLELAISLVNSVYFPVLRFIPTKTYRRIMQIEREIKTLLKGIINKKQKAATTADEKQKNDFLGMLLESCEIEIGHNNDHNKKQKTNITLDEVVDDCKIIYLSGQEPTSTLLTWALILLAKHKDWQARARDEVLNAFGRKSPDYHALSHLKMVNMILQEVLRLYPPTTELYRTVSEDTKVGDIFLPAGVRVTLPVLGVQHDEKIWGPDAKEFNPNRFSEGISKARNIFFAFGWGPNSCIGSNFAKTEARLALVLVLQRFTFELSPSYVHSPSISFGTLQPQFGAPIIFKLLAS